MPTRITLAFSGARTSATLALRSLVNNTFGRRLDTPRPAQTTFRSKVVASIKCSRAAKPVLQMSRSKCQGLAATAEQLRSDQSLRSMPYTAPCSFLGIAISHETKLPRLILHLRAFLPEHRKLTSRTMLLHLMQKTEYEYQSTRNVAKSSTRWTTTAHRALFSMKDTMPHPKYGLSNCPEPTSRICRMSRWLRSLRLKP